MPRGGNARVRRSTRRADARRSQKEGVNEALVLTADASGDEPSDDENFAAIAALAMKGECANCGHDAMSHMGDNNDGACSVEGCSCEKMEEASAEASVEADLFEIAALAPEVLVAAAGDIAWAPEEGVMDLLCDIGESLNPPETFRWWASDISLDLSKVLLCDGDDYSYWVVPVTISNGEPTLAERDEWVEVDAAWVEAADGYRQRVEKFVAHVQTHTGHEPVMKLTLRDLEFTEQEMREAERVEPFDIDSKVDVPAPLQEGELLPDKNIEAEVVDPEARGPLRWVATLCPEGVETDDGRVFAPGSIEWRELPLSLMGMVKTADGHDGAEVCGRIDQIWREEATGLIRGAGVFDTSDFGAEIARMVADETLRGISVDIAVSEMEIVPRATVLSDDGEWLLEPPVTADEDEVSMLDVLFGDNEEPVLFVVRKGIIGAATVCPFQAFREATIEMAASLIAAAQSHMVWTVTTQAGFTVTEAPGSDADGTDHEGAVDEPSEGLVASGALTAAAAGLVPEAPPREWFDDPQLEELTGLTITEDGRVFGHAAAWDTCHIGIPGVCTTAPESHSDYAYFHLKEIVCDDGSRISCGTITVDAPHAKLGESRVDTARHYDHTGSAGADVVVGEDDFGIWVAGALRPDADAASVRKLRGAALSGDWRDVNGNLELVALLAVNVPGFPVPRTNALVASADDGPHVVSLVAAGVHNGVKVASTSPRITATEEEQIRVLEHLEAFAQIEASL